MAKSTKGKQRHTQKPEVSKDLIRSESTEEERQVVVGASNQNWKVKL